MDLVNGLPALADTDPGSLMGLFSRNLRSELNNGRLPFGMAGGFVSLSLTGGGTINSQAITFPISRFTQRPLMLVNVRATNPLVYEANGVAGDTVGGTIYATKTTAGSATVTVEWWALQMFPNTAYG